MISIQGNLSIRKIRGRNGIFCVGKLLADLGEFAIKSQLIEEFAEGTYHGRFSVSRIFPASYVSGGRVTCEVRADLVDIDLDSVDKTPPKPEPILEPDPLDEEQSAAATSTSIEAASPGSTPETSQLEGTPAPDSADSSRADETADRELFGSLWPLANVVKTDPTTPRAVLRKQMSYLSAHGYEYQPQEREWLQMASAT